MAYAASVGNTPGVKCFGTLSLWFVKCSRDDSQRSKESAMIRWQLEVKEPGCLMLQTCTKMQGGSHIPLDDSEITV